MELRVSSFLCCLHEESMLGLSSEPLHFPLVALTTLTHRRFHRMKITTTYKTLSRSDSEPFQYFSALETRTRLLVNVVSKQH